MHACMWFFSWACDFFLYMHDKHVIFLGKTFALNLREKYFNQKKTHKNKNQNKTKQNTNKWRKKEKGDYTCIT